MAQCGSFGYIGWAFKNYYSKFCAFGPLKSSNLKGNTVN